MKFQIYTLGRYYEKQISTLLWKIIQKPAVFKEFAVCSLPLGLYLKQMILSYLAYGDSALEQIKPKFPFDYHGAQKATFADLETQLAHFNNIIIQDLILACWMFKCQLGQESFKRFFDNSLKDYWDKLDEQQWPQRSVNSISPPRKKQKVAV